MYPNFLYIIVRRIFTSHNVYYVTLLYVFAVIFVPKADFFVIYYLFNVMEMLNSDECGYFDNNACDR